MVAEQLTLPMRAPVLREPHPDCIREASFSDDGSLRWFLKEVWRAGPIALWCGVNPSWANAERNDMTIHRVRHFTRAWGWGGWCMVNQYPWVTSDPLECRRIVKRLGDDAAPTLGLNLHVIEREAEHAGIVMAAWGNGAWESDWTSGVVRALQGDANPGRAWPIPIRPIHCLGKTLSGAPQHPMARGRHRIPDSAQPVIWRKAA